MNTIYPSKDFLSLSKKALNTHEILEISIKEGWRARMLAKEVESWVPIEGAAEIGGGLLKAPSAICGLLMISLITIHYAALSAKYEMRSKIAGDSVVLIYIPL